VRALLASTNRSPAVRSPTPHRSNRATTSPRFRRSPVPLLSRVHRPCFPPGGWLPGASRPADMAWVPTLPCSGTAGCCSLMYRSFHDEVEHAMLVQLVGGPLVPDGTLGDHQNVVSQPQAFFDLTGDHHDGGSLVDEPADQVVALCSGSSAATTAGLAQQDQVTAVHGPPGQHGCLLVSPAAAANRAIRATRCEVQGCSLFACCLALGVLVEETAARDAPEGGQGDVAVH